jgi:Ca-activated chloride channel family protein
LGALTLLGVLLTAPASLAYFGETAGRAPQQRPTFKAAVDRVSVAVTVRTKRGRQVTNLKREDFELYDGGVATPIVDFRRDASPLTVSLLVDFSGSMDVAVKREAAAEISRHLLSWMMPTDDKVGLFTFDRTLQQVYPPSAPSDEVLLKMKSIKPYGQTSLFDAIAEAGRELAATGASRRAVIALTDGADNASRLTAAEVSGIASSIDVPVYIVIVVSPLDRASKNNTVIDDQLDAITEGRLGDLARWTGGEIFAPVGPSETSLAARQVITELRNQYLIAFQPSGRPGWHPIDLRTHDKDYVVRARTGYFVNGPERP